MWPSVLSAALVLLAIAGLSAQIARTSRTLEGRIDEAETRLSARITAVELASGLSGGDPSPETPKPRRRHLSVVPGFALAVLGGAAAFARDAARGMAQAPLASLAGVAAAVAMVVPGVLPGDNNGEQNVSEPPPRIELVPSPYPSVVVSPSPYPTRTGEGPRDPVLDTRRTELPAFPAKPSPSETKTGSVSPDVPESPTPSVSPTRERGKKHDHLVCVKALDIRLCVL